MIDQEQVKRTLRELTAVHADFLDALALNVENDEADANEVVGRLRKASADWREAFK